jgi:phage/plasmid-associated DNA primase
MRVSRLLSRADLQVRGIPFSRSYLLQLEKAGRFPARVRLGCNSIAWREHEINAWIEERSAAREALKSDVFKRLITGEPVPARNVYCPATDFTPTAQHVLSGNVLPSFAGGMDQAVLNRLLPIPFDNVVPPQERDPKLIEKILRGEADIFLDFAVEGARRLIAQGGFTIPESSVKKLEEWASEADPVRGFAKECVKTTEYQSVVSVGELYRTFVAWAAEAGYKREFLPSAKSFGRQFRAIDPRFQYDRANGSIYRNLRIVWKPQ